MSRPVDSNDQPPDRQGFHRFGGLYDAPGNAADEIEPLTPDEIAALVAAGALHVDGWSLHQQEPVQVSGWRVPDLGQGPHGAPAFRGLTPRLAGALLTRYTRAGQLVLDLSADLAVEGVAVAGGRRYQRVHPLATDVLVDARHRDAWAGPDLILLRWPPDTASAADCEQDRDNALVRLLRDCRDLLQPSGHVVVSGLDQPAPTSETGPVLESAARSQLRLAHWHVAVTRPTIRKLRGRPASPQPAPPGHVDILVFTEGRHSA